MPQETKDRSRCRRDESVATPERYSSLRFSNASSPLVHSYSVRDDCGDDVMMTENCSVGTPDAEVKTEDKIQKMPNIGNDGEGISLKWSKNISNRTLQIVEPEFSYKNLSQGSYRYDNQLFVCSVVSDQMAGSPFERFIQSHDITRKFSRGLRFWNDAQEYLSSTTQNSHSDIITNYIKFRRRKILIGRYFRKRSGRGLTFLSLPHGISAALQDLPSGNQGNDLVREAQDCVLMVGLGQHH